MIFYILNSKVNYLKQKSVNFKDFKIAKTSFKIPYCNFH